MAQKKLSSKDYSVLLLTAGLIVVFFMPINFLFNNPSSYCVHKNLLGFDCPICGMTRSLFSLLHGRFSQAVFLNVGIVPFTSFVIVYYYSYFVGIPLGNIFVKASTLALVLFLLINYLIKLYLFMK